MALIVFDGFDHYATGADILSRSGPLVWTRNDGFQSFQPGRSGYGKSYACGNDVAILGAFVGQFTHFFCGFACQLGSETTAQFYFNDMSGSGPVGTPQFYLQLNGSTGTIAIYSGAGTFENTSTAAAFTPTVWNYIEIGAVIGTAGSVTVRINGVQVVAATFDTVNTANTWVNGIRVQSDSYGSYISLDDFYWCDNTTGAGANPCNTFLGDVSVDTLFPTSNFAVAWTPLANTNWQEVSELSNDGDVSYNSAATVGAVDTYNFGPLRPTATAVLGVQTTGAYRKDDATARTLQQRVLSAGSTADGTTVSIPATYTYETDLFVVDPSTTANWTVAAVNAIAAGYELVS